MAIDIFINVTVYVLCAYPCDLAGCLPVLETCLKL